MTYRGYKSWRPNSRRNRRSQGGSRSRARSQRDASPATDRTFLLYIGGFLLLAILAMLALVLL